MLSACANVFRANHGSGKDVADLPPGALNTTFTPKCLIPKVEEFNAHDMKRSKVQQITNKVDEVRDSMFDNMRAVLTRGDTLEVVQTKTSEFSDTAELLHTNAVKAAEAAKYRLWRMKVWSWCSFIFCFLFIAILVGGYIAEALICDDWTLQKCFFNGNPATNTTRL